jgi:hypothetical protein
MWQDSIGPRVGRERRARQQGTVSVYADVGQPKSWRKRFEKLTPTRSTSEEKNASLISANEQLHERQRHRKKPPVTKTKHGVRVIPPKKREQAAAVKNSQKSSKRRPFRKKAE